MGIRKLNLTWLKPNFKTYCWEIYLSEVFIREVKPYDLFNMSNLTQPVERIFCAIPFMIIMIFICVLRLIAIILDVILLPLTFGAAKFQVTKAINEVSNDVIRWYTNDRPGRRWNIIYVLFIISHRLLFKSYVLVVFIWNNSRICVQKHIFVSIVWIGG